MKTHIARRGKIIGQFSDDELAKGLSSGSIVGGDDWWRQGMKEWLLVSSNNPLPPETPKPQSTKSQAEQDWRIRPKHRKSLYGDVPATEKQLALLKQAGVTDLVGLTKYDASRWIDLILGSEEGHRSLAERQFAERQEREERNKQAGLGCNGHRTPSGQYREDILSSFKAIEELRAKAQRAIKEEEEGENDPEVKKEILADLKEEEKSMRESDLEDIEQAMGNRVDYWIWVITCAKIKDADERFETMRQDEGWSTYIYVEDALVNKLFSLASRLPRIPTKREIKNLLIKLDERSVDWDDTQPDLLLVELLKQVTS